MTYTKSDSHLLLAAKPRPVHFKGAASASNKTLSIHRWANWIAGFSGEFAQSAIQLYLPFPQPDSLVLDPFAGVGTTLVEAYRAGIDAVGFEINPFASLVTRVKLQSVDVDISSLWASIEAYTEFMAPIEEFIDDQGHAGTGEMPKPRSSAPSGFVSRIPFFSQSIEPKVLYTLDFIETQTGLLQEFFRVALASVMVGFSNYTYEPSLSSRPGAGKALITSAPVGRIVKEKLVQMAEDTAKFQQEVSGLGRLPQWREHCSSYFDSSRILSPGSVDLVVTSPPYLNNYHYVRNTRPQLYWSALASSPKELKVLEEQNFGKFWQTVRGRDPIALNFKLPELEAQIAQVRRQNPGKGVYGGQGWANYIAAYMNDLYRFADLLAQQLRPRSGVAVVVLGNSVIQGQPIPVERYLAEIASLHHLTIEGTHELRTRVGSSIVNTGARLNGNKKYGLYDFAVVLRSPT